jgi:hypothetical protein
MNARDNEAEVDLNVDVPRIQDLEQYLQQNGLQQQNTNDNSATLDQRELAARIQEEDTYKDHVLEGFLKKDQLNDLNEEKEEMDQKQQLLDSISGSNGKSGSDQRTRKALMSIITPKETIDNVSLYHFVDKCDTIYAFVKSDQWCNSVHKNHKKRKNNSNEGDSNGDDDDDGDNNNNSNDAKHVTFSLAQFDHSSILEFIAIVQESKKVEEITPECIIECCRIAHFLQAKAILQEIVDIIKASIDADNCASICILADQLHIPSLMHSSMEYVMDKLDNIQTDDIWDDFPKSLQHHVITLRNAAKSSIIGRGHTSKVLFTSSDEFIGIFSDTLREHKERLQEAKMRQEEIIQDRVRLNERRGRYAKKIDVYSGSVTDAAVKIEKQEIRLQTLETFYKEQKAIFSRDAATNGVYKSSFTL